MKDVRLAIRFFWKWLPVNNLSITLMGVAIVLLTVGGAVLFSREKFKKYGVIAGKVVLFLLLFYQVVYAITQYHDEHSPIGRIMPWKSFYKSFNGYFSKLGYMIANSEEKTEVAVVTTDLFLNIRLYISNI